MTSATLNEAYEPALKVLVFKINPLVKPLELICNRRARTARNLRTLENSPYLPQTQVREVASGPWIAKRSREWAMPCTGSSRTVVS